VSSAEHTTGTRQTLRVRIPVTGGRPCSSDEFANARSSAAAEEAELAAATARCARACPEMSNVQHWASAPTRQASDAGGYWQYGLCPPGVPFQNIGRAHLSFSVTSCL
jgi:hypothetical protein